MLSLILPFARSFQHLLGMLNLQGYESNPVLLLRIGTCSDRTSK